jgi:hypothetical protein
MKEYDGSRFGNNIDQNSRVRLVLSYFVIDRVL